MSASVVAAPPARRCTAEACDEPARSGGYCKRHYTRWYRHGDPLVYRPDAAPPGTRRVERDGYVTIKAPEHPLANGRGGWTREHRIVLFDAIGWGPHPCAECGEPVDWGAGLHVDHRDGNRRNNDADNLRPSCFTCNVHRATPRRCEICGVPIDHLRADAKVCGPACRCRKSRGESLPPVRPCRVCRELLIGRRVGAQFCSERCRTRFRRSSRTDRGLSAANAKSAPSSAGCKCAYPLPVQRGRAPWKCETCGARVPPPFDVGARR